MYEVYSIPTLGTSLDSKEVSREKSMPVVKLCIHRRKYFNERHLSEFTNALSRNLSKNIIFSLHAHLLDRDLDSVHVGVGIGGVGGGVGGGKGLRPISPPTIQCGITDEELVTLSVRDLNRQLKMRGLNRDEIVTMKQRSVKKTEFISNHMLSFRMGLYFKNRARAPNNT